jgi:ribosomal small subunit protein bTHX
MGKGDPRSKRGKINIGKFGVSRLKKDYMKTLVDKILTAKKEA